jgi:hypothetical protein
VPTRLSTAVDGKRIHPRMAKNIPSKTPIKSRKCYVSLKKESLPLQSPMLYSMININPPDSK